MPVVISMLRGVNLGAHRRMKMEDLRQLYESLGCAAVKTYVQSGNVVFRSPRAWTAEKIERAIEERFGFHSEVVMRTAAEMRDVIVRNPFPGVEGSKLLVWFLTEDPGEDARTKALACETAPERLSADGRELFIYFPNGMARPNLNMNAVGKAVGGGGTGRNWNTVTKLLEIAEQL